MIVAIAAAAGFFAAGALIADPGEVVRLVDRAQETHDALARGQGAASV